MSYDDCDDDDSDDIMDADTSDSMAHLISAAMRLQTPGMTFDTAVKRVLERDEPAPVKRAPVSVVEVVVTDDPVARAMGLLGGDAVSPPPPPPLLPKTTATSLPQALGFGDDFAVEHEFQRRRLRLMTARHVEQRQAGTDMGTGGTCLELTASNIGDYRTLVPAGEDYVLCPGLRAVLDNRIAVHVALPRRTPLEHLLRTVLLPWCIDDGAGHLPDGWPPSDAARWYAHLGALVFWLDGMTAHARLLCMADAYKADLFADADAGTMHAERLCSQRDPAARFRFLTAVKIMLETRDAQADGWSKEAADVFALVNVLVGRASRLHEQLEAVQEMAYAMVAHLLLPSASILAVVDGGLTDPTFVRLLFGDWALSAARASVVPPVPAPPSSPATMGMDM